MIQEILVHHIDSNATDPKESAYYLSVNRNKHSVNNEPNKKKGKFSQKKNHQEV